MTPTELERHLGAVLHQRAEDAMTQTDPEAGLQRFRNTIQTDEVSFEPIARSRFSRALAAAVVALVAGIGAGVFLMSDDAADPAAPASSEAVAVAVELVTAIAAHDRAEVEAVLADDADTNGTARAAWRRDFAWTEAAGFRIVSSACGPTDPAPGGITLVTCTFAMHGLGSEELGRGPYQGNDIVVGVRDGEVVSFRVTLDYMENGFSREMFEPFRGWIATHHSEDGPVMYADWPLAVSPAHTDRSIRLWERRIPQFVADVSTWDSW